LLRGQTAAGAESARLAEALKNSRALATVIAMRDELAALWERSHASKEQLLRQLQDWCHRAEASGGGAARGLFDSPSLLRVRSASILPA
jgi:stearoyl-CoA desaturase (delta-9 desaturase)